MVRNEVQSSASERTDVFHIVIDQYVEILQPSRYEFVNHPRHRLFVVHSVLFGYAVVVPALSSERNGLSGIVDPDQEFLENVHYEHREFASVHGHMPDLSVVHSVRSEVFSQVPETVYVHGSLRLRYDVSVHFVETLHDVRIVRVPEVQIRKEYVQGSRIFRPLFRNVFHFLRFVVFEYLPERF